VSIVCLAGQILTAAHEATERHVRCAEHGETSHVPTVASAITDWRADGPLVTTQVVTTEAGHDHCAFIICGRRTEEQPAIVVSKAPEPPSRPAPSPSPTVRPQTDRILLSAPKNAPPAC
jgi:hypothetical protein